MILQLVQKPFMLQQMQTLQSSMDKEIELQQQQDAGALHRRDKTGVSVADLQNAKQKLSSALAKLQNEPEPDAVFVPCDTVTSITQSMLQYYIVNYRGDLIAHDPVAANSVVPFTTAVLRSDGKPVVDLFAHFRPADVGWTSCLVAEALRKAERGPRSFNKGPAPINPISNKARVVLLADWGTGVPRAHEVASSARRFIEEADRQHRDVYVVHLGGVYYSGQKFEYDQHFLRYWPVSKEEADKFSSYSLNSNRDMYSGGYDYFDYLLADKRFRRQHQCSFFGLENDFWQMLALDTAYVDSKLADPQPQWVLNTRNGARRKKGILLSHHEPFSAFETTPPDILKALKPVTDQNLIVAWWWGHQHRCAFYDARPEVRYPRCIGNGGVPILAGNQDNPPGVSYQFQAVVAGTNPPVMRFGFAVMDFNRDQLHVQYLGEKGVPHAHEDIGAAAAAGTSVSNG